MQSRWMSLASRGGEDTRFRLRRLVAGSSLPGRKRRRWVASPLTTSREFHVGTGTTCDCISVGREYLPIVATIRTARRGYHETAYTCSNRPIHTTLSLAAPLAATNSEVNGDEEEGLDSPSRFEEKPSNKSAGGEIDQATPAFDCGEPDAVTPGVSEAPRSSLEELLTRTTPDAGRRKPATPERPRSALERLLNFDAQNPPDKDNLEDLQLWLECKAQRESTSKYEMIVESARESKDYARLGLVQKQVVKWYQLLKDGIEERQREYLLAKKGTSSKDLSTYGPYICSLQPEKLAVITAHQAIVQSLLKRGDGATLATMALEISKAVEAEVNVQRWLRQQAVESARQMQQEWGETTQETSEGETVNTDDESKDHQAAIDNWMYPASHLKRFVDDANKASGGKNARLRTAYANRRALRLLNSSEEWSSAHKVKLGAALIEILLNSATLNDGGKEEKAFTYEKRYTKLHKKTGFIVLNEKLYSLIAEDKFKSIAPISDRHKPMVLPPHEWKAPNDGAYRWLKTDLMRTHGCKIQKEALGNADLTKVFDGLNALGRVPWRTNKTILSAAKRCWEENIYLGDIPTRTDFSVPPEPVRPDRLPQAKYDDKESGEYKAYMEEAQAYREAMFKHRRMYQKNMDLRSLRCSTVLKLDQADQFKDYDEFYFPYNMDFRGRTYPVPPHFSNVGSDLCRGLLKFAISKPLGSRGLYWLKVHLANLAGNDKMSFDGRAEFTERNMENIRAAVADPFGDNRWWMTLEDPFQGLATCHEIVQAIDSGDPETYECSLPVHMDGSCNGLQHYAALGRDRAGGKAVNLCNTDKPSDVYVGVMEEVIRRVAEDAAVNLSFAESDVDDLTEKQKNALKNNRAAKLVNGLIDRGVVKRTVMTSVYGVTFIGAKKQIMEKIVGKLEAQGYDIDENENEIFQACGYLASVTMEVMGELFTGARQTMNWLATCARLVAKQGQPVAWMSPVGVPVVQPYRQKKSHLVVTLLQSVILADESDDLPIDKARQVTAFPPNYVHSLDSSHMLLTALEMDRRKLTFSAVHDSFWTHPCDVDEMNEALRDSFVELYEQPLLEKLKEMWELRYPSIEFPEVPETGDLDLDELKSATYFFQ